MREYIVLANHDHYNHLGIVRALGEAGIRPIVIAAQADPPMACVSRYTKEKHVTGSPEACIRLLLEKYAGSKEEKSFILTGDDVSVAALDAHYDELKDYFYFYNAGETGRIQMFMNKDRMAALAARHGLNIPRTWRVRKGEIPEDLEYPVMTKALHSFGKEWKNIVVVCRDAGQLQAAYEKIQSEEVILQRYLEKKDEMSVECLSVDRGRDVFISMEAGQVYSVPERYSPYWVVRNFRHEELRQKIRGMIAEIGLEGVFEYEFLVGADGQLYFMEINFRNTVLGYATHVAGMPMVKLWCEAMLRGRTDQTVKPIPEGFTAMAECYDYDVRVKSGAISRRAWWKEYRQADAKLYRGRKDFRPFFSFMWYKLTKMRR